LPCRTRRPPSHPQLLCTFSLPQPFSTTQLADAASLVTTTHHLAICGQFFFFVSSSLDRSTAPSLFLLDSSLIVTCRLALLYKSLDLNIAENASDPTHPAQLALRFFIHFIRFQ
jgi:hypothetical protein